jgi:hypothetical protein
MPALHQVDAVARQVVEADQPAHLPLFQRLGRAGLHRQPAVAELGGGGLQRAGMAQLEADGVVLRVAFEIHQRVLAVVAAVVARAGLDPHQFQADDVTRKAVGRRQVARAQSDVADVEQVDHSITRSACSKVVGGTFRPSAFAVFRFSTISMRVGRSTGVSAALAPLSSRSTMPASVMKLSRSTGP